MYDHILVALDGSEPSRCGGQCAIALAVATGARVTACHVYGAEMHRRRFIDMEPGLPAQYQEQDRLRGLRTAHDQLIDEGFRALSTGYVEDFLAAAREAGVPAVSATAQGRSYVGILQLADRHKVDLIVLGAAGLGAVGDGLLGGTTTHVLANAPCDVLVARRPPGSGPILTGVDGSAAALKSAAIAVALGQKMNKPISLTAAYDPEFHTRVFVTMAHSLSPERQEQVGLANQEKLHDDIINDGLGKLYGEFLREAQGRLGGNGTVVKTSLVTGKAYCALEAQARQMDTDLIVIGRYGHHRESCSFLGSNAEGLLRTTLANVLLVGGCAVRSVRDESHAHGAMVAESAAPDTVEMLCAAHPTDMALAANQPLTWDTDAQTRLQRVPSFVRSMARRAVESAVREAGGQSVSAQDFDMVAARFGMGPRGANA
jgi:nucleotide-binding universal stress UspA family protein